MTTATLAVPYSLIPAKPVHWLHDGFVPFRHVTVVIGQGGTSKGIATLDYAARMTRGDPMPGETESTYAGPMDVVVVLPEDDPNEAVAGRLAGAGAITDRVHNLTILPGGHAFTVPADIPLIGQAIDQIEGERFITDPCKRGDHDQCHFVGCWCECHDADSEPRTPRKVGMVILDPLLALAGNDLRTRGQARPVMEALEQVAQNRHLVIFLTHHANADGRAASSRAITETARNVITLARTPKAAEDDPVRVLTISKTNIGRTGQSLRYMLTGSLEEPHVAWECEQPPADDSRGYDMADPSVPAAAAPVKTALVKTAQATHDMRARCKHPWKAGSCSDCPLRAMASRPASIQPAGKHAAARPPYAGIPLNERYRASRMHSSAGNHGAGQYGKPEVLGDYDSRPAAKQACEQLAGQPLAWHDVPVPGMEGAEVTMAGAEVIYGALDRYARAASKDTAQAR